MMVDGPAALAIGAIGRQLWTIATGERLEEQARRSLWPADVEPDFRHSTIGLSCTSPNWRGRPAVHEGLHLAIDMLREARQTIYIEAQYFAASFLADVLIPALDDDAGPEIVLILSGEWHSRIEKRIFGGNRDRLLRRLKRADRHGRLAAFFPEAPGEHGAARVLVHSKVIIVDDRLLRVGSSNLNNRSTGLDAECDLAVEPVHLQTVRESMRCARGCSPIIWEAIRKPCQSEIVSRNSVIAAIGALDPDHRRLVPFAVADEGPVTPVFGTALVDPARPFRWA